MGLFYGNRVDTRALVRQRDQLAAEVEALKATVRVRDRDLFDLREALVAKDAPQPVPFAEVTRQLVGFVPSLPAVPGYGILHTAKDSQTYAQGLHMMLLHARTVGQHEGKAAR